MRFFLAYVFGHHPILLVAGAAWGWVEIAFFPQPMLLLFLAACMFINMVTGAMKAWKSGTPTTKEGLRKTGYKLGRYGATVMSVFFMLNIIDRLDHVDVDYTFFINGTVGFLSFVELYSIFENIEELDPTGPLSFFIKPILKFLRGRIKNNVARQAADQDDLPNSNHDETK